MTDFGLCKQLVENFHNQYPPKAIYSIRELASNISFERTNGFESIELQKSFDEMVEYLEGFVDYKLKESESEKTVSPEVITERTQQFIEKRMFGKGRKKFKESYDFINSYFDRLQSYNTSINAIIEKIQDSDLPQDVIGTIMEYSDSFLEKAESSMNEVMKELLHCSGYKVESTVYPDRKNDFFL